MNAMTYNWLCRGYARNGSIEELSSVMEVLRSMRVRLDAKTRFEILDAYSSKGLFEQTLKILKSLRATLDKHPDDLDTALSRALLRIRVPRELKYALQELEKNGFKLTKAILEEQVTNPFFVFQIVTDLTHSLSGYKILFYRTYGRCLHVPERYDEKKNGPQREMYELNDSGAA